MLLRVPRVVTTAMSFVHAAVEQFWAMVDVRGADECWPWRTRLKAKYPAVQWPGHPRLAPGSPVKGSHIALFLATGSWPRYVEHRCDNPACCNPAHLFDSNHAANMAAAGARDRLANSRKTHCPAGHSYAEHGANRSRGNGKTFRVCRLCERAYTHRRRGAEKATHTGPRRLPA